MKIPTALFCLLMIMTACQEKAHYDLVIINGSVLDGSGVPAVKADIAIRDGVLVKIGDLRSFIADQTIDASGLTVSPGFIDLHTHIEPIMEMPDAESHVRQGVTTALGGPDGGGPWPFGHYLDSLRDHYELGMNVGYLVGHNAIRRRVMGNENREPSTEELEKMKRMVGEAMKQGAFGISTGLKYLPGAFSKTPEVIELSKVAAGLGGIYTSHLREEGLGLIAGVKEAIEIGREASIPIVLTHHKAIGKPMWGASRITTAMVDSARSLGIDVMMDQYPYTASYTGLSVLFPAWALEGTEADFKTRTETKSLKEKMLREIVFNINNDRGGGDLSRIQFARVSWDSTLEGKTLLDYAMREGVEPTPENGASLAVDIQLKGGASCIFHAIGEEDVERIMQHPFTMHASDARLSRLGEGHPHPRAYGTFPRVLGVYVREKEILTLEEAIRKMTSLPASRLGLTDRGLVKEGYAADLTVFDAGRVKDRATFEQPHQYPVGIEWVVVNGHVVVQEGKLTGNRGGQVLRGPAYQRGQD